MVKIDVSPLKAKSFASTHGREGQENEKRAPRLLRQTEDGFDLGMGEVRGDKGTALWQNQLR